MKPKMLLLGAIAALAMSVGAAEGSLCLWVELIGFDNAKADMGVGDYLARMPRKPDCVTLLLNNESLFRTHAGLERDYPLHFSNCAYRGRPYNREHRRQDWTAYQLRTLVKELRAQGVRTLASFFCWDAFPATDEYMDRLTAKLVPFLKDFGFDGFHGADGYAPPFYPLPECDDRDRPAVARRNAAAYAANVKRLVDALRPEGLECWLNSCWTLDPYEAMFRYGVDHRLLARAGITGFFVECSATGGTLEGWMHSKTKAAALDIRQAMLLRLKASVPDTPCVLLHGINDGAEQWSALRHAPTMSKTEALALGSVFYGKRRALDGFLACLADGIGADEWRELEKTWSLAFSPAKGPEGIRVVWSDRAFDAEFDACAVSRDASSNTLLRELIRRGAVVNAAVSVEDALADPSLPILLTNPQFFPEDELGRLRARPASVVEIGLGARSPNAAPYVRSPDLGRKIPGMPSNAGWDDAATFTDPIPENLPPDFIFDRVTKWINAYTSPFQVRTPGLRACAFRLANGRLGVMVRSCNTTYVEAQIALGTGASDVQAHTDFPSLPVRTVLEARIAPQDTIFLSVGERGDCGPNRPPER